MYKLIEFIKRRKIALIIIIILLSLALYFFIPRRLSNLCIDSNATLASISVWTMLNGAEGETKEYRLTKQEDIDEFKDLLKTSCVRPKIFNVEYVNGGYEGYYFFFEENSTTNDTTVFLFTSKIITINGRQFILYDKDFSARLKEILHD